MHQKILEYKELIRLAIFIGIIYIAVKLFLTPLVNSPEFIILINDIGLWGYLIIFLYIVVSHVFAPVSGTPGVALGVAIYGIGTGMWLLYYAGLVSCIINFCIAREYGKKYVSKIIGEKAEKEVEELTSVGGERVLFIARLFGFSFFDFISYAAGLTKISFKSYFTITAVASLIVNLVVQFIFKDLDFKSEQGIMIWLIAMAIVAVVFGIFIKFYLYKIKTMKAKVD